MSLPVPLGVRFYGITNTGERWVTRWVDDISFRSVIPGGFASATITLRVPRDAGPVARPDPLGFSQLVELFKRVQVVDLRTCEIAWEGRIEDPARQVDPDTWQIGALGSMVCATDIQRPVFYVDSSTEAWNGEAEFWNEDGSGVPPDESGNTFNNEKSDGSRSLISKFNNSPTTSMAAGALLHSWRWDSHGYDQPIARFTTTHNGSGPNAAQDQNFSIVTGVAADSTIDVTAVENISDSTKTNILGTDFTDQNTRYVILGFQRDAGTGSYDIGSTAGDLFVGIWKNPKVVAMRRDRTGAKLITAASYTTDYVTVAQVVEDVVGRFLVGGWYEGALNTPYPGSVRSSDVYIDATSTTQILHLTYADGVTAADVLNDMIDKVQPNAYWAIWESKWGPNNSDADAATNAGFRFEFATWPNNWGYLASSQDGMEGQPNGDDVYSFVSYRYPDSGDLNAVHCLTTWTGASMNRELYLAGFTRSVTVTKQDPTDSGTAGTLRDAFLAGKNKVLNTGTITIKRPIPFYDAGSNSGSGAGRWVDPWMIRPGKLIRISDLPPRAHEASVSFGTTLPSTTIDGTIFRVVATEYSSSDNSCRLELDQVSRWSTPTQITAGAAGASKSIRIQ